MSDATCPNCAEPVVPGDQFCEACGVDLPVEVAAAARPADAPPAQSPEHEAGFTDVVAPAVARCSCGGTFVDGWCDSCGNRAPDPRDHVELDHGAALGLTSDKGLRYPRNEDGFAVHVAPDLRIAVVCDGVSSTVDPHLASEAASERARDHLVESPTDLLGAHRLADEAVRELSWVPRPDHGSPSCTFLAASVVGGTVWVASLGDCRGYWLPATGDEPVQVTSDDSWAQEQVDAGAMTLEEALTDRRAHVITRWLGRDADPTWRPDVRRFDAGQGGLLVLCSDGLWNYTESPQIVAEQVAKAGPNATPAMISRHLVEYALDSGGHDNVTVACLPVPAVAADPSDPADPEQVSPEPSDGSAAP